jgi:hypothetical protein
VIDEGIRIDEDPNASRYVGEYHSSAAQG